MPYITGAAGQYQNIAKVPKIIAKSWKDKIFQTIEQQRKVFNCIQLTNFNIIVLNGKNKKPDLKRKNIYICSKQFLQTKIDKGDDNQKHSNEKTKTIPWLQEINFDMRFIDESHNGGTTELAKKTLDFYGKNAFTVYLTATYSKPVNDYNIPKDGLPATRFWPKYGCT